jgi:hypothetical protein
VQLDDVGRCDDCNHEMLVMEIEASGRVQSLRDDELLVERKRCHAELEAINNEIDRRAKLDAKLVAATERAKRGN